MATTLATATLDLAKILTDVVESVTSAAGSSVSVVDGAIPRTDLNDDHFNRGTLWALSSSVLTEGTVTSSVITDFTASTGTFTCSPPFTYKLGSSGISYAASAPYFPRDILRRSVNVALQNISPILTLSSSLTTVADQETYSLQSPVRNVKYIERASSTSSPYNFYPIPTSDWEEKNDKIYFTTGRQPQDTGYTINLWYSTYPASDITTDAGAISSYYPPEWLKWEGAVAALQWRDNLLDGKDPDISRRLTEARMEAARCRQKYMSALPEIPWEVRKSTYLSADLGIDDRFTGTVRFRS